MELPRIGNEAIKKELNCNCSCRAHDIYVRIVLDIQDKVKVEELEGKDFEGFWNKVEDI